MIAVYRLQNDESEVLLLMKGKRRKAISGLLSIVTILSALIQPFAAFAEEPVPVTYEAEYPALEKVRSELADDEIVMVKDHEIESGSSFDVEQDFSGMEIPTEKVTVKFYEAKNKFGQDFDVNRADTYQAVYFVEPASGHPAYHVSRKIIVKEKADALETERIRKWNWSVCVPISVWFPTHFC